MQSIISNPAFPIGFVASVILYVAFIIKRKNYHEKLQKYRAGKYQFLNVTHQNMYLHSRREWIRWIDKYGKWL